MIGADFVFVEWPEAAEDCFVAELACDGDHFFDEGGDFVAKWATFAGGRADVDGVHAEASCEPFVFHGDPLAADVVGAELWAGLEQLAGEHDEAAQQCGDAEDLCHCAGHIADAEFDGAVVGSWADVPFDVFV